MADPDIMLIVRCVCGGGGGSHKLKITCQGGEGGQGPLNLLLDFCMMDLDSNSQDVC